MFNWLRYIRESAQRRRQRRSTQRAKRQWYAQRDRAVLITEEATETHLRFCTDTNCPFCAFILHRRAEAQEQGRLRDWRSIN